MNFVRNGTLRLATNQARVDEFKLYTARDYYCEGDACRTTLIDGAEAHKLCRHLAADKVLAALYTTGDGFIDAAALCRAYAAGARKLGAHVVVSEVKSARESLSKRRRIAVRWASTERQMENGQSIPTWAKSRPSMLSTVAAYGRVISVRRQTSTCHCCTLSINTCERRRCRNCRVSLSIHSSTT